MSGVKIWLDSAGIQDILKHNSNLQAMEQDIMQQKLNQIQAEFLQAFGSEGNFYISKEEVKSRTRFAIRARDRKTGAILKSHPGWLDQFIK